MLRTQWMIRQLMFCLLCIFFGVRLTAAAELRSDTREATAGYFRLTWQASQPVQLSESRSGSFSDARIVYSGDDTARVMSGKPDGDWHYRLESYHDQTPVTEIVTVTVKHHPLDRAWLFFALGGCVFLGTCGLIAFGQQSSNASVPQSRSKS